MTTKTRDELLLAIASGLESLLSESNSEFAKDDGCKLLKCIWKAQKEKQTEEDEKCMSSN